MRGVLRPHHVAFSVSNIEQTENWYAKVFGWSVIKKFENSDFKMSLVGSLDDFNIELFQSKKESKPLPRYRNEVMSDVAVIGTKHLCLEVTSLEEITSDLLGKDVRLVSDPDEAFYGGRFAFIRDPDGNLIELCELEK
ncbi:MAG: VOC family protein [Candidatus Saccharimonadales bacterium]